MNEKPGSDNLENVEEEIEVENEAASYRGIIISLISAAFLSLSNVFVKKAQFFRATEQTAIRYTMQLIVSVSIAHYNQLNIFGPRNLYKMLVLRGILGSLGLISLHLSVTFINPSDAVAIFHTNVILVAFIARFTLNEKFSFFHVIALLMAVSGTF